MGIATSKAAQVTLTIAPSLAAIPSIAGSSYIVHHILRENKHKQDVRFRLLLLLSIADLLNSISVYLFWSLPLPSDTPNVWGALGNKQTCDLQGFLAQWTGITNAFYNGALCHFYYVMLVGHSNSNSLRASTGKGGAQLFAQRYEKWWHVVAWGFPITTAILALWPLDVYAYVHIGCWIGPYPLGCTTNSDVECTRGRHAYVWGWLFGGIPLLAMLAVVGYFMFQIYQHIRQVTQQSEQYAFPSNVNGLDRSGENDVSGVRSSGISSTRFSSGRASSNNMVGDNDHHNESNVDQLQDRGVLAKGVDQLHDRDVLAEDIDQMQELSAPIEVKEYGLNEDANERDNAPSTPQFGSAMRQFSSVSSSSSHRNSTNAQPQNITRLQAQRKESATQAFLYIGAYCVTHQWNFIVYILAMAGVDQQPFILLFLCNFCFPLQGFLNVFIFLRPRIKRIRATAMPQQNGNDSATTATKRMSFFKACYIALFRFEDYTEHLAAASRRRRERLIDD